MTITGMKNYTEPAMSNTTTQYIHPRADQGGEYMVENLGEEKSIYLQISEMIEDEILRDILKEEEQVPSTTELSKFYKINPATAAKGINLLVDKGILYKKRGIGMFVQEGAKSAIQKSRQESFYETYVTKIVREAKLIGITKEELSKMIKDSKEA